MKNTQSKLVQPLTTYYHSRYRLFLTDTPLRNNLPELWTLLNLLLPRVFNSVKSFDGRFNTPFANAGTGDKIELNEGEALFIIKVRMSALQSQPYKQITKYEVISELLMVERTRRGTASSIFTDQAFVRSSTRATVTSMLRYVSHFSSCVHYLGCLSLGRTVRWCRHSWSCKHSPMSSTS